MKVVDLEANRLTAAELGYSGYSEYLSFESVGCPEERHL